MLALNAQPSLDQIYVFIAKVHHYPISVRQLLTLASDVKAPKEIIKFYDRFSKEYTFEDPEELVSRSEQVGIMQAEEVNMPKDGLFVPGED